MTPIGWGWALLVWGYCLIWVLIEDRVKLEAYRIFDLAQPVMRVRRKVKRWVGRHFHNHNGRF
jgi:H+-transporting ATPase